MNVEMVEELIKESKDYPDKHFGLKVGEGWPEFVTALLESKQIRHEVVSSAIIASLSMAGMKDKFNPASAAKDDPFGQLAREPMIYEIPLKFLFWGVQIGKRLAEIEKLERLA